jgi:nucleoside-diphosphate-sugar epimerase
VAFKKYGAVFSFPGVPQCAFTLQIMNILVTGASGFVGRPLCAELFLRGHAVRAVSRFSNAEFHDFEQVMIGTMDGVTDWSAALDSVDAVIHLAARVHVMDDRAIDPLAEFRKVNVLGTLNLASQAVATGVKRFVLVSSVKVNGESTLPGQPFTEADAPYPQDAYGLSKHEAELGLRQIAAESDMEVVIIRPPLVYGPGVKANFAAMMRWLQRGIPLPLGAIHNKRSLVALDNLVNLVVICLVHPAAANQTFLVSDGEDVSTTELLQRMGRALRCPARLIPLPASWLKLAAAIVGKQSVVQRLCGSLQVDIGKTRRLLGWKPPLSLDEGLRQMAGEIATSLGAYDTSLKQCIRDDFQN